MLTYNEWGERDSKELQDDPDYIFRVGVLYRVHGAGIKIQLAAEEAERLQDKTILADVMKIEELITDFVRKYET